MRPAPYLQPLTVSRRDKTTGWSSALFDLRKRYVCAHGKHLLQPEKRVKEKAKTAWELRQKVKEKMKAATMKSSEMSWSLEAGNVRETIHRENWTRAGASRMSRTWR